jgi:serine/threonine protein phosphatase PrpC
MQIDVIDSISDPGKPERANEDRLAWNASSAFVVDGATGLGDQQFMTGFGSDAAWIAEFAAKRLMSEVTPEADFPEIVRRISQDARISFEALAGDQPRYAWPVAALAGLRVTQNGLQFAGLGDSVTYILHDDGREESLMALPDAFEREQAAARAHVARLGGIGAAGMATSDPKTLADLRRNRERQNTADGTVWSLSLVPETADHIATAMIDIAGGATAIICSDGLADLVSLYGQYTPGSLIRRAVTAGLPSLIKELRQLEREIDPEGLRYPRLKQSDDTTAILCRIT